MAQVARDHGVDPAIVVEAERRKSFFIRVAEMAARGGVDVAPDPSLYVADETDTVLSLIRDALRDAADRGSVVLVAHAACYACADRPDVLRVGVTAPLPARASRVASAVGITDKEAAKRLHRSRICAELLTGFCARLQKELQFSCSYAPVAVVLRVYL